MNDTINNKIKKFIADNSELSYDEVSKAVDKYFDIVEKETEYEDDIPFYSPNDNDNNG